MASKKRWKCETSKELVLENRLTVCKVGSMLTVSFGSVQSILKDNLNMFGYYLFHAWVIWSEHNNNNIFSIPETHQSGYRTCHTAAKSLHRLLRGAEESFWHMPKPSGKAWKGPRIPFKDYHRGWDRLTVQPTNQAPVYAEQHKISWHKNGQTSSLQLQQLLTVLSAVRQLCIMNLSHKDITTLWGKMQWKWCERWDSGDCFLHHDNAPYHFALCVNF